MAVYNNYVNTQQIAGDKVPSIKRGGHEAIVNEKFESAVADDDGSVYRVFRVPSNAIPLPAGIVAHDNISGGTGFVFGLYETLDNGGAEVDKDLFLTTTSFANTTDQDPFSAAMTVDNRGKTIWELLGLSEDPHKEYDWCITGDTVGAGGTINIYARYLFEG